MEPQTHLLLSDREAAEFRRSRRSFRIVVVSGLAVLILLLAIIGPPVVRHIDAVAGFALAGASVDWDLNGSNWTLGGVTRVDCSNGRSILADAALLRLKDLHRVEALDLAECELITESGLSALSNLRNLKALDLSRLQAVGTFLGPDRPVRKLTDSALAPLKNLTELTNLSVAGNLITDDGLAMLSGLTNLEFLDLNETLVTDAGLKHLKGLKRLKTLLVSGTKVTKKGALELQDSLSGLTEFNIEPNPAPVEAEN